MDTHHRAKEEDGLFIWLVSRGFPWDEGVLAESSRITTTSALSSVKLRAPRRSWRKHHKTPLAAVVSFHTGRSLLYSFGATWTRRSARSSLWVDKLDDGTVSLGDIKTAGSASDVSSTHAEFQTLIQKLEEKALVWPRGQNQWPEALHVRLRQLKRADGACRDLR